MAETHRFPLASPYLAGSSDLQFGKSPSRKLTSSLSTRQRSGRNGDEGER